MSSALKETLARPALNYATGSAGAGLALEDTRLTVRERPGKWCFRFWQEGPGFDRNFFSSEAITASLDYIHNNPVNRRLCPRAVDWRWSSARFYLVDRPAQSEPELPFVHGLPDGVLS
ncbi:MAG: hypothetical protein ACHRXM_20950 [Isosphaerales bacterium]